jgi:hypothetical protein
MKMKSGFQVVLNWDGSDGGTYSEDAYAANEDSACIAVAEAMAKSGDAPTFDSEDDKEEWIRGRARDVVSCESDFEVLKFTLERCFGDVLFEDGCHRMIDLEVLSELITDNKTRLVQASGTAAPSVDPQVAQ